MSVAGSGGRTLQAIIFDFDGVIANSEPLHLRAFQGALADHGIPLTRDEYFGKYLGFDDVGAFKAVARDRGFAMNERLLAELVALKGHKLQKLMEGGEVLFDGAARFIRAAAEAVPVAIASGALRHEIDEIIEAAGVAELFSVIVASGDTPVSKPSPEPYRLAYTRLHEMHPAVVDASRCVAIEDSRWGLESARGAGLRCVGVTNSYPEAELVGAELVVAGLHDLTLDMLDDLVRG